MRLHALIAFAAVAAVASRATAAWFALRNSVAWRRRATRLSLRRQGA
jgi:hypothetical protein